MKKLEKKKKDEFVSVFIRNVRKDNFNYLKSEASRLGHSMTYLVNHIIDEYRRVTREK